jgi:hypothetical protein
MRYSIKSTKKTINSEASRRQLHLRIIANTTL